MKNWPASDEESADADLDGDGIPQRTELLLAQAFFPTIWYDDGEDCTEPGGSPAYPPNQPGRLVYRVRPHPLDGDNIAITFALLYAEDCGEFIVFLPIFERFKAHPGDVEPFAVTLQPNPDCALGYGGYALSAWAHHATAFQHTSVRYLHSACALGSRADPGGTGDIVLASENKHGNYLEDYTCDVAIVGGHENCDRDFILGDVNAWVGFNAGEAAAPRHHNLAPLGFPGEEMWTGRAFCGSLRRDSSCPGPVERKLDLFAPSHSAGAPSDPPNAAQPGGTATATATASSAHSQTPTPGDGEPSPTPNAPGASATPTPTPDEPQFWQGATGSVAIEGTRIVKTGQTQAWDAEALSVDALGADGGYVQFTLDDTTSAKLLGLDWDNSGMDYTDVDFGIFLQPGQPFEVREQGAFRGAFAVPAVGDIFRLEVVSGTVRYVHNDQVIYTSAVAPSLPLYVDALLYTPGAGFDDVVLVHDPLPGEP